MLCTKSRLAIGKWNVTIDSLQEVI